MNTSKLVNICIIVKKLIKVFADKLFSNLLNFRQLIRRCTLIVYEQHGTLQSAAAALVFTAIQLIINH